MMPILLLSKNEKQINTYSADFAKKQSIAPYSIFQYRKNPNVIGIEQIREIQSHLARAASMQRLFIVYDFETARKETQNAFLKTLEEQGDNAYFILVAPSTGPILPTVLSRCVIKKLKVRSLPQSGSQTTPYAGIPLGGKKSKITMSDRGGFLALSLPELLSQYKVTDREKAVRLCEEFLITLRDMMSSVSSAYTDRKDWLSSSLEITHLLKEIVKTRGLLLKNNLNPQIAIDHLLIFFKTDCLLTKTHT